MLSITHVNERGHFKRDWRDSFRSFSFGEYIAHSSPSDPPLRPLVF